MYVNTHAIVIEMYKMLTAINYYKSGLAEAAEQKFCKVSVENNLRKHENGERFSW